MTRALPQPTAESIDLGTVLSALADPVRLAIMRTVFRRQGPVECGVVAMGVDVSAPTLSHHWRVLREAGLTSTVVDGRKRIIQIRRADVDARFPGLLAAVLEAPEAPGESRQAEVSGS